MSRRIGKMGSRLGALALFGLLALPLGSLAAHPAAARQMATKTYEVTITNLTPKQVLSPPLVAAHPASVHVWQMGQLASEGVRMVAEEGDPSTLAASLKGTATDVQVGPGPIMPGKSATIKVMTHDGDVLSAIAMLVETNDGFTGVDSLPLAGTMADKDAMAYDAGTEENTELAADVPGPPFGGHMHGTPTNPRQPISMHPGISGKADVTADYGWSGPVARISVHEAMMSGESSTSMGGTSTSGAGNMGATGSMSGSESSTMPDMPKTGAGDNPARWLALAALGVLLSGLVFRLAYARLARH